MLYSILTSTEGSQPAAANDQLMSWILIGVVIVLVIVRRQLEKRSRRQRVKAESAPVVRPAPQVRKPSAKKDEPSVPEDENDPYNN